MITELQDSTLLPKISGVDLMAAKAKYHLKCLTDLRNRYRRHTSRKRQESCEEDEEKIKESQAFIELVEYIEVSTFRVAFTLCKSSGNLVNSQNCK